MHDLIGDDLAASAPKGIKGAMLTCILSDTLEFRSPTTTAHDRAVAEKLAADLGVASPIYAAEDVRREVRRLGLLGCRTAAHGQQGIQRGGKKLRVSVLETTAPQVLLDRKASADGRDAGRRQGRRRRSRCCCSSSIS
jgi:manganese-dependent inorganic pyrophosphatase